MFFSTISDVETVYPDLTAVRDLMCGRSECPAFGLVRFEVHDQDFRLCFHHFRQWEHDLEQIDSFSLINGPDHK